MTRIRILNQQHKTTMITLTGHADYDPGHDIVCSAISLLAYTLINYMLEYHPEALPTYQDDPGNFVICIDRSAGPSPEIDTAICMFEIGAESLAGNYPENVEVNNDTI